MIFNMIQFNSCVFALRTCRPKQTTKTVAGSKSLRVLVSQGVQFDLQHFAVQLLSILGTSPPLHGQCEIVSEPQRVGMLLT